MWICSPLRPAFKKETPNVSFASCRKELRVIRDSFRGFVLGLRICKRLIRMAQMTTISTELCYYNESTDSVYKRLTYHFGFKAVGIQRWLDLHKRARPPECQFQMSCVSPLKNTPHAASFGVWGILSNVQASLFWSRPREPRVQILVPPQCFLRNLHQSCTLSLASLTGLF